MLEKLNLLCFVFFFPSLFRRGIKKRDYAISEVSIGLYFSVAIKWYRTVKLQIALKIQDIRDAWCWNSHSILKLSVFRIIAHFTISAEIEKIRKLKIPSVIEKNCKHTYYYTDRSYHENPTCSNISRLIKFSGWRKMFVYKL